MVGDTSINVLVVALVSDLWSFALVIVRAKKCWRLLLSIKPLHPTWIVDRVTCMCCEPVPAGVGTCSLS